jgi:hypothetical protein
MTMVDRFREQATLCGTLGSPMYAALLDRVADDVEAGGVSAQVLAEHEDAPGPSALALRLAGSVHRLVLEGRAAALAAYYPSVGGSWDLEAAWPAFVAVLRGQRAAVRERLDQPPQTNEVGRAAALMGGLLCIGETFRLPVRLFETGSSAGLNLLADRFGYTDERGRVFGDEAARLVLSRAWRGRELEPWSELAVVERAGSDVMPVDVGTAEGRLTLASYVWPDQVDRLDRLRGALEIAAEDPPEVRRQDAGSFVQGIEPVAGCTTVLWHSVMWQYLSREEQAAVSARVERLGAAATATSPFGYLFLEPTRRTADAEHEFLVVLRLWPTGQRRVVGTSAGHGLPTTWE